MSPLEFGLMFVFGLISSVHCVQMCGPIVLSYSLPLAGQPGLWRAHLSYNLGRTVTYTALGALAGASGSAVGWIARLSGFASGSRIVAGAAMMIAGVYLAGLVRPAHLVRIDRPGFASRLARFGKRFMLSVHPAVKFRLGLLFGFLPCGLIYAALLKAVDTGSVLGGALSMLAFGIGTSLALAATGFASTAFRWRLGRWSNSLAGVSIMIAGALLIWTGVVPGAHMHHHAYH